MAKSASLVSLSWSATWPGTRQNIHLWPRVTPVMSRTATHRKWRSRAFTCVNLGQCQDGNSDLYTCGVGAWQGCRIWYPIWVRLERNGTNLGLFKISFSTFWRTAPKCTETDLKKVPDLSHLGLIWSNSDAKFDIPATQTWLCQASHIGPQWNQNGFKVGQSETFFPFDQRILTHWSDMIKVQKMSVFEGDLASLLW